MSIVSAAWRCWLIVAPLLKPPLNEKRYYYGRWSHNNVSHLIAQGRHSQPGEGHTMLSPHKLLMSTPLMMGARPLRPIG
jgi:hypothetical protein